MTAIMHRPAPQPDTTSRSAYARVANVRLRAPRMPKPPAVMLGLESERTPQEEALPVTLLTLALPTPPARFIAA